MTSARAADVVVTPMLLEPPPASRERLVNEVSALALRLALRAGLDEGTAAAALLDTARRDHAVLVQAWRRFERAMDERSSAAVAHRAARFLLAALELSREDGWGGRREGECQDLSLLP